MSKLLERLDELEKAAVPGPWEADKSGIVFDDDGISICTCKDRGDGNPNARLIKKPKNQSKKRESWMLLLKSKSKSSKASPIECSK